MALIDDLVAALTVLPGVGPKSAQRMGMEEGITSGFFFSNLGHEFKGCTSI